MGEILDVKVEESVLGDDGKPDIEKVRPILFSPDVQAYHGVGQFVGKAFDIGKGLKKKS